jgi:hypothetical protein
MSDIETHTTDTSTVDARLQTQLRTLVGEPPIPAGTATRALRTAQRRRRTGWAWGLGGGVLVAAAATAAVVLVAQTGTPTAAIVTPATQLPAPLTADTGTPTPDPARPTPGATESPVAVVTTPPAPTDPTTTQNLPVTDTLRQQLLAAFVAGSGTKNLQPSEVIGPIAGKTYYAYLAPTRTYWALARFQPPSPANPAAVQNGSALAIFSRPADGTWSMTRLAGTAFPCPGELDPRLMTLWGLANAGSCTVAQGAAAGSNNDTLFQPRGTALEEGQYFGHIRSYRLNLDGSGDLRMNSAAGVPGGQQWDQHPDWVFPVHWAAGVVASYSVGDSPATSHVVNGTFDQAYAQRVTNDFTAFTVDAYGFIATFKDGLLISLQEVGPNTPTAGMPFFGEFAY